LEFRIEILFKDKYDKYFGDLGSTNTLELFPGQFLKAQTEGSQKTCPKGYPKDSKFQDSDYEIQQVGLKGAGNRFFSTLAFKEVDPKSTAMFTDGFLFSFIFCF
jgi:hypothetical protein